MGAILPVLAVAGVGISAFGQVRAGQQARQVYEYNEAVAKYQAKYIQDAAKIEEGRLEREVRRNIGRQRALAGRSGTVPDTGSNLDALLATREEAEIDAAIIRYNADVRSNSALSQADLFSAQGKQAETSGFINAGATLLTGASRFDFNKKRPSPLYAGGPPVPAGSGYSPFR